MSIAPHPPTPPAPAASRRPAHALEQLAATEAIHEATRDLDQKPVREILEAIHLEDLRATCAVGGIRKELEAAAEILIEVLTAGGRWFNIGAGTSGRMGCLDAAELSPTFGFDPERIQGIIAGGPPALMRAVEGAEDDEKSGAGDLVIHGIGKCDAVLAISASGRTPYTLAALRVAKSLGARTLALTCDPDSPLAQEAELAIAPVVGPEVIAGSTRMKGGLAQKMVLHQLSTAVMIRLGRVRGNLMSHLRPASRKLEDRAVRIVAQLAGTSAAAALQALEASGGDPNGALAELQRNR